MGKVDRFLRGHPFEAEEELPPVSSEENDEWEESRF